MSDDLIIRERREDDLDALVEMLMEQQPTSLYPHRWPLPFPPWLISPRTYSRAAQAAQPPMARSPGSRRLSASARRARRCDG